MSNLANKLAEKPNLINNIIKEKEKSALKILKLFNQNFNNGSKNNKHN